MSGKNQGILNGNPVNSYFLYFQLNIPYGEVLCKNRYVGRTFIQPNTRLRKLGVAKKFGLITENFRDKRVVLIDDSIVRGNTMKPIIQLLKSAGAKEVSVLFLSYRHETDLVVRVLNLKHKVLHCCGIESCPSHR